MSLEHEDDVVHACPRLHQSPVLQRVWRDDGALWQQCQPIGVYGKDVQGIRVEHHGNVATGHALQETVQGIRSFLPCAYARSYAYGIVCRAWGSVHGHGCPSHVVLVVMQDGLGECRLHYVVVPLGNVYRQFTHARTHASPACQNTCTCHAITACHEQCMPEGALVTVIGTWAKDALQEGDGYWRIGPSPNPSTREGSSMCSRLFHLLTFPFSPLFAFAHQATQVRLIVST